MSLREQDKVEDRQESFSFSNYDFSSSSSAGVVLSDGEDSDESYIEIELEQAKSYRTAGDVQSDGEDGEIELRISISSHTPFPQLSVPSFSHVTDAAESGSSQSSSSANYASTTCFWSKAHNDNKKVIKSEGFTGGRKGAVQFPAVSRLLSMLISSLKVPPENCQENRDVVREEAIIEDKDDDERRHHEFLHQAPCHARESPLGPDHEYPRRVRNRDRLKRQEEDFRQGKEAKNGGDAWVLPKDVHR